VNPQGSRVPRIYQVRTTGIAGESVAVGRPAERRPRGRGVAPGRTRCDRVHTDSRRACSEAVVRGKASPTTTIRTSSDGTRHDSTLAAGAASCRSTRSLVVFTPALRDCWLKRLTLDEIRSLASNTRHARRIRPRARTLGGLGAATWFRRASRGGSSESPSKEGARHDRPYRAGRR
jgi:hypothetical protein